MQGDAVLECVQKELSSLGELIHEWQNLHQFDAVGYGGTQWVSQGLMC